MGCKSCDMETECVFADGTFVILARVVKKDNTNITQAATSSVRVDVYELDEDDRTAVDSTGAEITTGAAFDTPDKTVVIFDALQTDSRWTKDSTGYDFAYAMILPDWDKQYEVRITITTTDGQKLVIVRHFNTK
jgi:hypothetical protein